jgi:hypothetical protein
MHCSPSASVLNSNPDFAVPSNAIERLYPQSEHVRTEWSAVFRICLKLFVAINLRSPAGRFNIATALCEGSAASAIASIYVGYRILMVFFVLLLSIHIRLVS